MLTLTPVTPVVEARGEGCLALLPEYPPHALGTLIRDLRVTLGIPLHRAARGLSLTDVELCALERGASTLTDAAAGFQEVVRIFILMARRRV